jgi:hypothetical protein
LADGRRGRSAGGPNSTPLKSNNAELLSLLATLLLLLLLLLEPMAKRNRAILEIKLLGIFDKARTAL